MVKTIAVSAKGPDLDSPIDQTFERCNYFIFVDPDTLDFSAAENPAAELVSGAGTKAAEFVIWHGATIIIAGTIGANVKAILHPADVDVITEVKGTVRDAIMNYRESLIETASIKEQELHWHKTYGIS